MLERYFGLWYNGGTVNERASAEVRQKMIRSKDVGKKGLLIFALIAFVVLGGKQEVHASTLRREQSRNEGIHAIHLTQIKGAYSISWKSVSGAAGYDILISKKKNGKYRLLEEIQKNHYNSYNLIKKGTRYYRVVPYYRVNGKKVYSSQYATRKVSIDEVRLDVEFIPQNPELPTGCEATALTMVLKYHGFKIDKLKLVERYLPQQDCPGDFYNYYVGNPKLSSGLGIFAPGLTKTANHYLKPKDTNLRAYNITGAGIDKICEYVAMGYPVCIWTTCNLHTSAAVTSTWKIDGKLFEWKANEHCMTVIGFNRTKKTLIIANPLSAIEEYPMELIELRNNEFNKMAIVIK